MIASQPSILFEFVCFFRQRACRWVGNVVVDVVDARASMVGKKMLPLVLLRLLWLRLTLPMMLLSLLLEVLLPLAAVHVADINHDSTS